MNTNEKKNAGKENGYANKVTSFFQQEYKKLIYNYAFALISRFLR